MSSSIEALTKQVAALENELKERNERLETATERLSDRELEISILQKRLEIRSSVSKKGQNKVSLFQDQYIFGNEFSTFF